jgi:hypothetical protein
MPGGVTSGAGEERSRVMQVTPEVVTGRGLHSPTSQLNLSRFSQ